jgi:hypothetical protein
MLAWQAAQHAKEIAALQKANTSTEARATVARPLHSWTSWHWKVETLQAEIAMLQAQLTKSQAEVLTAHFTMHTLLISLGQVARAGVLPWTDKMSPRGEEGE